MKFHIIATGGAVMHNLALALHQLGHEVTGSDDEIYEPAKSRLAKAGLLPNEYGWFPDKLISDIDTVILGMHARKDNVELLRAQELGLNIRSFPEFIYEHAKGKIRIVVAGSHGKTTTTSMIMHAMRLAGLDFDYLVGAQLKGFDTMVRLSDAPYMVIEGDEYLSSPLDLRSKMLHYQPQIAIITGIAWDHINVFPTFESYLDTFKAFIGGMNEGAKLYYYAEDPHLPDLVKWAKCEAIAYSELPTSMDSGRQMICGLPNSPDDIQIGPTPTLVPGKHNRENFSAAWHVARILGVATDQFKEAIETFEGAAKRMQVIGEWDGDKIYLDFAHAPSKVKATVDAVSSEPNKKKLAAFFELHTFSSLNREFLPQYAKSMGKADLAVVYFSLHTLEMKKMPMLSKEEVADAFSHPNIKVFTEVGEMEAFLNELDKAEYRFLFMTSGNFGNLNIGVC